MALSMTSLHDHFNLFLHWGLLLTMQCLFVPSCLMIQCVIVYTLN